jgi:type I restriction enzyme R subunit
MRDGFEEQVAGGPQVGSGALHHEDGHIAVIRADRKTDAIRAAVDELLRDRLTMGPEAANRAVYLQFKEGIKVSVPESDSTPRPESLSSPARPSPGLRPPSPAPASEGDGRGGQKTERVRVVDWEHPANNDFLLVSQFSVTGARWEFRLKSFACRTD